MRISDWSSDVCSSDLIGRGLDRRLVGGEQAQALGFLVQRGVGVHPVQGAGDGRRVGAEHGVDLGDALACGTRAVALQQLGQQGLPDLGVELATGLFPPRLLPGLAALPLGITSGRAKCGNTLSISVLAVCVNTTIYN